MRALCIVLFLVGLAMLGHRYTIAFGILLCIGSAILYGKVPERGGEAVFTGLLLIAGAAGAIAVLATYFTARP